MQESDWQFDVGQTNPQEWRGNDWLDHGKGGQGTNAKVHLDWTDTVVPLERTCVSEGAGMANMHHSGVSCRNRDD